mmetsp:Transcript_8742/g.18497  ORF Transcript_8742/g.18497 Transcript_8742/m.18497 type:complete len:205 (-) Transcript_8742:135-749(-)
MGTYYRNASKMVSWMVAPGRPHTFHRLDKFNMQSTFIQLIPRCYNTRQTQLMDPENVGRIPKKIRRRYNRSKVEDYLVNEWIPKLPPNGLGINKLWDDIRKFRNNSPKKWLSGEVVKAIAGELARRNLVQMWRKSSGKIKLMPSPTERPSFSGEEASEGDRVAEEGTSERSSVTDCMRDLEQQTILDTWQRVNDAQAKTTESKV